MKKDNEKITRREAVSETITEVAGLVLGPIVKLVSAEKEEELVAPVIENTVPREKRQKPSK